MPNHTRALKDLPERIRTARKAAGLTQGQLGEAVGVPTSRVSDYESGGREPSLSIAAAIADALKIDLFPRQKPSK